MAYTIYYRKFGSIKPWKKSKTVSNMRKAAERTGLSWHEVRTKVNESLVQNPEEKMFDEALAHEYQIVKY